MVFFATTIDDFASQSFCGYAADNTLIRGQSTDVLRLVGQQFTVIRNKIPRNLSDLRKLTCGVFRKYATTSVCGGSDNSTEIMTSVGYVFNVISTGKRAPNSIAANLVAS